MPSQLSRQIKIVERLKSIAEDIFSEDVIVKTQGMTLIISPRDLENEKDGNTRRGT